MWAGGSWQRDLKVRGGAWRADPPSTALNLMDLLAMWSKVTVHPASPANKLGLFQISFFSPLGLLSCLWKSLVRFF